MATNNTDLPELLLNEECPKPAYPALFVSWLELCQEYPYLRVIADRWGNEPSMPRPLDRDTFLALLGTLQREPYRSILQHLLFALLQDGIKIVVQNALEGGAE